MIEIRDVHHHYNVRPILKGIDLTVNGGELLAVMGPNGMGKSTLLAVVAGVLWPTRGHVAIDGFRRRESVEVENEIRRRTVYLPAEAWLPEMSTGREFLLAVGRLYGIDDHRLFQHAERLFRMLHLEDKADSAIAGYSSGQKKKIALASALIVEARVMILDEPFSGGLDPSGIMAMKQVLRRLRERRDVTLLIATPVPELVEEIADRIAIIEDGRMLACGTVDELRAKAGRGGNLQEVMETILGPETLDHIEEYFSPYE